MKQKEDHNETPGLQLQTGLSRVTRVTLTWRDGPSLSVILSEVSEPQELLSLISCPLPVLLCARGEAGGARRAAHTML